MIPTYEEIYAALAERHGAELQKKLSTARTAVCGLGGLGSNIAVCLVRAGVGHVRIIDFDRVDISNINRQQYFLEQIGQYKTDALYEILKKINPYCEIVRTNVRLNGENIPEILGSEDIICEAFDDPEAKAELVNCVLERLPEKYLIAASGMAGLISANLIKTRKVAKRFYLSGDGESDVSEGTGLVSSRVMVCAAHQAHKAIQIINALSTT
ncbi:MAG: sulfur carrier protein ThiS adenylyltransferase ThiF [Ruminococcus sp.]|nr:sulfur carrier protein ThiS adenylyltransferase ThiF [Ruminococcus sp.]